jgi:serine protease
MGKSFSLRRHGAALAVAAFLGSTVVAAPAIATEAGTPPSSSAEIRGTDAPEAGTNRFIVKFRDKAGISATERAQTFSDAAAPLNTGAVELLETGAGASVVVLDQELDVTQSAEVIAALAADPEVEYVEPDILLSPSSVNPNDPLFDMQWDLWEPAGGANVPAAWATSEGAGQIVAVVDTGSTRHSDLNSQMLPGYDLISSSGMARDGDGRDSDPQDEGDWSDGSSCGYGDSSWHGTHVAGTVAASTNNGTGMSGVAPGAKIVPVRVLGECGGYLSDIADGIIWAAGGSLPNVPLNANPANVINLSLGGIATCSAHMQGAVDLANSNNAVVVVAAGNDNVPVERSTPANCQNVVAVGATGRDGSRARYSNYGSGVDIMAPGGDMYSDYSNGILSTLNAGLQTPEEESYSFYQGTSMAAPHVAGAAALLMATQPGMTPAQVEARLKATARDLPNGCAPYCGPKLLDVAAAVTVPLEAAPVPTITGTTTVGNTLTAVPGIWAPAPVDLAYQWNRGNTAIPGATAKTYKLTAEDSGQTISVAVTGSKKGYAPATKRSAATAKVAPATLTSPVPTITGTTTVGNTLTAVPGTWAPAPVDLAYQWNRGNTAIPGATAKTYKLTAEDSGQTISVAVTGTKNGYAPATRRSAATAKVAPVAPIKPVKPPFADVPVGMLFFDEILWMANEGISTGWTEANGTKTYRPLWAVNRDAMAAFMYRLDGSPDYTPPKKSPFADVATSNPFYKEIAWLNSRGISTGWKEANGTSTYRPTTPVNRDAMAAFMYRFAGSPSYTAPGKSAFRDVPASSQFYPEISWLASTGISTGWDNGTFRPLTPVARDAMAAFMKRFDDKFGQ